MTIVQFDSQKIEQLLKSATSERQRKMYQALLEKARKQERSSTKKKTPETIPSTEKTAQTTTKSSTKTQKKTKTVKKNQKIATQSATIEITTPTKQFSKTVTESKLTEDSSDLSPQTEPKSQSKKSKKQPRDPNTPLFQALGAVIATPYLKDDFIKVVIDGSEYNLLSAQGFRRHVYTRLKEDLEKNGSREMFFRLYPNVKYDYKSQKSKVSFSLVCFNLDCEKINEEPQGFVLRGIWQYIPHYESPVISIYRNRESIEFFKKLNKQQQSSFARPLHIPVVWDAPVEPFKFKPEAEKDSRGVQAPGDTPGDSPSQMPRYFVEVRAIFKDGVYVVEEMLSEPTRKIPKFIKVSTPRLDKLGEPQRPSRSKKKQSKSVEKTAQKAELAATT